MIDIHCHLLPGIDDGPSDWDEAVSLCRAAAAEGGTAGGDDPLLNRPGVSFFARQDSQAGLVQLAQQLSGDRMDDGDLVAPDTHHAARPDDARHLRDSLRRIRDVADPESDAGDVEAVVREGERCDIGNVESDGRRFRARELDHLRHPVARQIQRLEPLHHRHALAAERGAHVAGARIDPATLLVLGVRD